MKFLPTQIQQQEPFIRGLKIVVKSEEAYYKSDYECLYPPTRAAGNDNLSELKRLIEWVDKSSDEDFKDNIEIFQ